jgi:hypothetical protein
MKKGCALIIFTNLLVIFVTQASFAGYNYDPLIATAPSEVHPVGTDVTLNETVIGGSGSYSYKWYKVNENGSETLVGTGASYHAGVINDVTTDKYRFQVTDTVQNIIANDLALVVIFVKVRTLHFDEGSEDADGWGPGSAPSAYTPPCFGVTDGSIKIKGVDYNTYGYWESTKDINDESIVGKEQPHILYMSRSLVKTDVWDSVRVPCTRLRMNRWIDPGSNSDLNFGAGLGGALMVVTSPTSSPEGYRPNVEGRYLDFFYAPSFREWDYEELYTPFSSSMDFVNIGGNDDPNGILSLEEYSLLATSVLGLPEFTPDYNYTFDTDEEGWQQRSAAPIFTAPVFLYQNGDLTIQGVNYTTYGYWESPDREYENGRLYRASFAIRTNTPSTEYSKCPSFRLRVNSGIPDDDWAIVYVVDSDDQAILSPKNTAQIYDVYFLPPQRDSDRHYTLSFDYVNFNTKDNETDILYLDEVQISYLPLSELFSQDSPPPDNEVPIPYSPNNEQNVSTYPVLKARRRANYSLSCTPSSLEYEFYFKPPWGDAITKTVSYSNYEEFPSVRISPDSPLPWGEGEEPYVYTWKVRVFDGSSSNPPYSDEVTFTVLKDKDGDGIPDDMDYPNDLNADANNNGIPDGEDDDDNDGIPNYIEYQNALLHGGDNRYYMNPISSDTDNDGLSDIIEYDWNTFTNANIDSDGDGIKDTVEITQGIQTDPFSDDTDQDGITDDSDNSPVMADLDNDFLEDGDVSETYPLQNDSDGDGFPDGFEVGKTELVDAKISPSGILCKGSEGLSILGNLYIDEDPFYNSIHFSDDNKIDFIGNGKLDKPELLYNPEGPNYYWEDMDCGITTTWTYEQLSLSDGSWPGLGSYGSCWKYFGSGDYYPKENKIQGYYYHIPRTDDHDITWYLLKFYDLYSYDEITGTIDISMTGNHEIKPSESDGGITGNIYVFDVECLPPSPEDIPRKIDDPPVEIPYKIDGIKDGALRWMKIYVIGKDEGWDYPYQRVFNVTESEGTITWNGMLYRWESRKNEPRFLKKSSNVYFHYEICVKNRFSSLGRYNGFFTSQLGQCEKYSTENHLFNYPGLYFTKPDYNAVFLVNEEVKFQLNLQKGDYNTWNDPPITWSCSNGQNGTQSVNLYGDTAEFGIVFDNPGIYTITAEAPYGSDKTVKASCKVNVIQINQLTVTDKTEGGGGETLSDVTDDNATPDETLYIVQDKSNKAQILMDLTVIPQNINCENLDIRLLWRIRNKSGGDAYNWNRKKGNFMNGIPVAEWTDTGDPAVNREFEVYAGLDRNNNNTLDITQDANNEAFRKINILIMKIDLQLYKTGTMSSLGDLISQDDENNPLKLGLLLNDDNDDNRTGHIDNDDQAIGSQDNDIVKLALNILPSNKGTAQLSVENPSNIQVFKTSGNALLSDYSVNLESPSGDLAALSGGNVHIFIEGMSNLADEKISLIYKDVQGVERGRDEVHFALVTWALSFEGPDTILRGETGKFEVKTNVYGADTPGVDYLNWQFVEETNQKTVMRPVEENSSVWEGILVAPGTVSVFVDFPDRGHSQDFTKTYTITPRTGTDWELPHDMCKILSYKEVYPNFEDEWGKYPVTNRHIRITMADYRPCLYPIGNEYTYSIGTGPNNNIFYVLNTIYYTACEARINRFLLGSSDPPADSLGKYTEYSSMSALYSESVKLHESWGTNDQPPPNLNSNADGHHKLFWEYLKTHDIRKSIESILGFNTEQEFKNAIFNKVYNDIWENAKVEGNAAHNEWTDPLPVGLWIDFWDEDDGWFRDLSNDDYKY